MHETKIPIYCVVGKIAAGKNFVCSEFEKQGFLCIDSDIVIHQIIEEKQNEILNAFSDDAAKEGVSLQNADGTLNRRALGKLLFLRKELLAKQESIVYPAFTARVQEMINSSSTVKASSGGGPEALNVTEASSQNALRGVIINAAVLYKTPALLEQCQKIFFVDAPVLVRFARIRRRDNLPPLEILKRFWTQRNLFHHYKTFANEHGIPIVKIRNCHTDLFNANAFHF